MRKGQPRRWAIGSITDKELKVIELRAHGATVPEIAPRLGLSRTAVYNRLSRVYRKIGLMGHSERAGRAARAGTANAEGSQETRAEADSDGADRAGEAATPAHLSIGTKIAPQGCLGRYFAKRRHSEEDARDG
jgi:DNA-binding CsgD family transcriptional regulator